MYTCIPFDLISNNMFTIFVNITMNGIKNLLNKDIKNDDQIQYINGYNILIDPYWALSQMVSRESCGHLQWSLVLYIRYKEYTLK